MPPLRMLSTSRQLGYLSRCLSENTNKILGIGMDRNNIEQKLEEATEILACKLGRSSDRCKDNKWKNIYV